MKIILAYQHPHRKPLDEYADRKAVAVQQFADAGLRLDPREAHQITCGSDVEKSVSWFSRSLENSIQRWNAGDLLYVDYEPPNFTHEQGFDEDVAFATTVHTRSLRMSTDYITHKGDEVPVNPVSVYGLPASKWFKPYTSQKAIYGLQQTDKLADGLDWFGPQFYISHNLSQKPDLNNLHRLLKLKNSCIAVNPDTPMIPFIQLVIRNPAHDYIEMDDDTMLDMCLALYRAGITEVILFYPSGGDGQLVADHAPRLKRFKAALDEAYQIVWGK